MSLLNVSGIGKQENGKVILKEISFTQEQFRKIAIAGETGSGKSTLMKTIAGLAQPDTGTVWFRGVRVEGPLEKLIPGHPGIAYLSQHFELRNNYRVEEILQYANTLPGSEAAALFAICRIDHLLKRRTDQLSGGEKQRIALARLLIGSPRLLLLDEPFSNLDMIHKNLLKSVIRDVGERLGITCMLISHDPADMLSWADEILVLKAGEVIQQGPARQVYTQPVDRYSAALFGKYHLIPASFLASFTGVPATVPDGKSRFVRPENLKLTDESKGIPGMVGEIYFMGSHYELDIRLKESTVTVRTGNANLEKGETVYISLDPEPAWYL